MTLAEVASVCGGAVLPPDAAARPFVGMGMDSRRIVGGEIFVAMAGAKADGHNFAADAAGRGAAAALVEREISPPPPIPLPQIVVENSRLALSQWAAARREEFGGKVVAVTGSNGKTTVKEMLRAVCVAHFGEGKPEAVRASGGNFNNKLGVELTLSGLASANEILICETGMDAAGELAELSEMLRPDIAIINNAARAHLGGFSSVEDIARAKGELLHSLAADGTAVLNGEDAFFPLWKKLAGGRRVVSFGFSDADFCGELRGGDLFIEKTKIHLQVAGEHNARNALAAAAAADALGIPQAAVVAGLEQFAGVDGRLKKIALQNGSLLIDDSYNANPDSASAALAVLEKTAKEISAAPIFVMGDMAALGEHAAAEHSAFVAAVSACENTVQLFAFGEEFKRAVDAAGENKNRRSFVTMEELIASLREELREGKRCILVKGSRSMQMERVVLSLENGQ